MAGKVVTTSLNLPFSLGEMEMAAVRVSELLGLNVNGSDSAWYRVSAW